MKIFKISQNVNNNYDTYSDAVVCAETEEEARNTEVGDENTWCKPEDVTVEYIGGKGRTKEKNHTCFFPCGVIT